MSRIISMSLFIVCCVLVAVVRAEPDASVPPIQTIKNAKPNADIFKVAKRKDPVVIHSSDEAAKYFAEDSLAKLEKQVDFDQQIVLVFAWRGSGQDKLSYDVAESYPEQIHFRLIPGRTRDLRPHIYIYALRSNVKWSVR